MEKVILLQGVYLGKENNYLGQKMMHGFLKVLSQRDWQPKALFFLGDAVRLLTDEFKVIPFLTSLETHGVEILACRAAVEELNLVEKLRVGMVSSTGKLIELMAEHEIISL